MRPFTLDGKKGLTILAVNTGGGRDALEWALEQVEIIMIQEHRLCEGQLVSMQLNAIAKNGKEFGNQHSIQENSRSGGVATLVRQPILMTRGVG